MIPTQKALTPAQERALKLLDEERWKAFSVYAEDREVSNLSAHLSETTYLGGAWRYRLTSAHLTPPTEAERIEAVARIISPKVWRKGRIDDGNGWMIEPFGRQRSIDKAKEIIAADPLSAYSEAQQAEIERLREAAKGQLVVVNTAIEKMTEQQAENKALLEEIVHLKDLLGRAHDELENCDPNNATNAIINDIREKMPEVLTGHYGYSAGWPETGGEP